MTLTFKLICEFGEFTSEELIVTEEEYLNLVEFSKNYHLSGFDMQLPDGFMVISPEVVRKSILIIQKKEK